MATVTRQGRHLVILSEVKQAYAALDLLSEASAINHTGQSVQGGAHGSVSLWWGIIVSRPVTSTTLCCLSLVFWSDTIVLR